MNINKQKVSQAILRGQLVERKKLIIRLLQEEIKELISLNEKEFESWGVKE